MFRQRNSWRSVNCLDRVTAGILLKGTLSGLSTLFVTCLKEMDELPDDLVYPTPPLNKEQLLDIEEIFKDLIHGGNAFESAPPSAEDLAERFKSQNTPSGIDSVGSAPSPGTSSSSSSGGSPGASSPGASSSPNSPDPILREKIEKMAAQFDIDPDEYCEELKQMNQEQFSKCQYIKKG